MDIGGAPVEEIVLSSPEGNFHVLNRAEARQSEPLPVSLLLHPTNPVVKGGVSGKTDHPVAPSSRTLYKTEKENARARFEVEAEYEAWSPEPEPPPAMKARTTLAILIQHRLFSETVETGSLDNFKGMAEEFLASASQRMKVAEAFMEFSIMEARLSMRPLTRPDRPPTCLARKTSAPAR
jgi:hypothetical protein